MGLISIHNEEDYFNLLKKLLPEGPAWQHEEIDEVLRGISKELGRFDERMYAIYCEMNPATVSELVPEWEKILDLPDKCLGPSPSFSDRQKQVQERLVAVGSQMPSYFEELARKQGYPDAKVIEVFAPRFGKSRFGTARFGTWKQQYFWILKTGSRLKAGRRFGAAHFGERFGAIAGDALACLIERYAPAHTVFVIDFS